MSTNGILDFQNTNKIIFRGSDSNVVIDTSNVSLGIGIQGTETPGSNLHVVGDAYISSNLKLTTDTSILVNSNVVTNFSGPHARLPKEVPLKKYPEIIFESGKFDSNDSTNTYVQAGYTVSASRSQTAIVGENLIWEAFNGIASETGMLLTGNNYDNNGNANTTGTTASRLSASDSTPYGEWLKLKLPNKIKLNKYVFTSRNDTTNWPQSVEAGQVWGSDNDSDWVHLHTFTNSGFTGASQTASFNVTTNNYYKYYAFIVTKTFAAGTDGYLCIPELEYYGYEEDPPLGDTSVDTTFTSIMNTPQTTGANVYVDAKLSSDFTNQVTGPTPVGTVAVHDNTNKYWELTGALTSNITVEANTFLSGDAPHSISMWFNSSNLEANVSNTCVFSVSDQEHLNSENLDLQSNTWHNLTYAYQGEGGSKVTYLDGRKVAEDQAEDTFGEYPPFAMTGYSQGGYVVSVSSELAAAYLAHEAFNGTFADNGDCWLSNSLYTSGTGIYFGSANLGSDSGGTAFAAADEGEWLKLEMPHKFVLDYISICGSTATGVNPKDWKIYGSNDDKNWDVLLSKTNAITAAYSATSGKEHTVGASKAYKYFALVVTKSGGLSGSHYVQVGELEFYGHKEGDLTRLPEPTRVLKYPHVTMTGPAQRGYVASASSTQTGVREAWNAFDGGDAMEWRSSGADYTGSDGIYVGTAHRLAATDTDGAAIPYGEWLQIKMPNKILLQSIKLVGDTNFLNKTPEDFKLYGSINGSTWKLLITQTGLTPTNGGNIISPASALSVRYDYYALVTT